MAEQDTRNPAEIEQEIERTQDEMSRTVDRIGDQLTPRNLLNSLLDKAEENDIDARYIVDGARRNPLALGLIAAGGIWLLSDSDAKLSTLKPHRRSSSGNEDWDQHDGFHRSYLDHMSKVQRIPDEDDLTFQRRRNYARADYLMIERNHDEDEKSFHDRLNAATDKLRERRDAMYEQLSARGSAAASGARDAARASRSAYYDNPLVGGFVAALLGAVAGAVIPASQKEEDYLGDTGAKVLDTAEEKARTLGNEALAKKDEVVQRAEEKMST